MLKSFGVFILAAFVCHRVFAASVQNVQQIRNKRQADADTGREVSQQDSCSNGCSGQGLCYNGGCFCSPGFHGADCSESIDIEVIEPSHPPNGINCLRCHFWNGIGYYPSTDCKRYYVCEPDGQGGYNQHYMSCAIGTYWNQQWLTCVSTVPLYGCDNSNPWGPPPTTAPPSPCPLGELPDPSMYLLAGHVRPCAAGTIFSLSLCACVHAGIAGPQCDSQHFKYDTTFESADGVFSHQSGLVELGDYVSPPAYQGRYADFTGQGMLQIPYYNNWFAGPTVDQFTLAFWVNPDQTNPFVEKGLVNNGNCNFSPSVNVYMYDGSVHAELSTTTSTASVQGVVHTNTWSHVAMVYDGSHLHLYINGNLSPASPAALTGPILNTQCPMMVGDLTDGTVHHYFSGGIDELRIFKCSKSATEVFDLYNLGYHT